MANVSGSNRLHQRKNRGSGWVRGLDCLEKFCYGQVSVGVVVYVPFTEDREKHSIGVLCEK